MKIPVNPFIPGRGFGKIRYWWESEKSLKGAVIVIRSPSINDLISIKRKQPSAIVVLGGHRFSHTLLYLYTLGIPAVLAENEIGLDEGSWALVDGELGSIELEKSEDAPTSWRTSCASGGDDFNGSGLLKNGIVETLDGRKITIEASVNDAAGAKKSLKLGASKIGLTRSEFCFEKLVDAPKIEDHRIMIEEILDASKGCDVSIRLLDLGGGKDFDWVPPVPALKDSLGIRGCRALRHPELRPLLMNQLEAIKSVKDKGRLHILVPFVSGFSEFEAAKRDILNIVGENRRVEAMLETPSSVFAAKEISRISETVTIGTNDLIQCFFGASRELSVVGELLTPYSPSLYRFFDYISNFQNKNSVPFRVCGHLPLLPFSFEVLIGLGFRCFSVEPTYINHISKRVSNTSYETMKNVREKVLGCAEPDEFVENARNGTLGVEL